jgi:hypothetical protein
VVTLQKKLLYHLLFCTSVMISCFHRSRWFIAQEFLINIIEIQECYLLCVFRCSVSIGFSASAWLKLVLLGFARIMRGFMRVNF